VRDIIKNKLTDRALVHKVLNGETHAFAVIISYTESLVAQIVFKMISNEEDKRDIAQDIYLKAFQKLDSFRFKSKLSTWIAQIAYNTCINYLEKKKLIFINYFQTDQENEAERFDRIAGFSMDDTESDFSRHELAGILKMEINRLPTLYKILVTLYYNEELSFAEIAQITELPEGTIKSYLYRSRKILRENLLQKYKREEL